MVSVRCLGNTQAGKRCQKMTACGTYCYLHRSQETSRQIVEPESTPELQETSSMRTEVEPTSRTVRRQRRSRRLERTEIVNKKLSPKALSAESKPSPIKPKKWVQDKPDECPVCMDVWCKNDKPLPCGHWVHNACVLESGKKQCPICRAEVDIPGQVKYYGPPPLQNLGLTFTDGELYLQTIMLNLYRTIREGQQLPVVTRLVRPSLPSLPVIGAGVRRRSGGRR